MLPRLITIVLAIMTVPVFAQQQSQQKSTATTSPVPFVQQKTGIDSLVQVGDTTDLADHAAFSGKARLGRYRVECYYSTPSKEIIKANYIFITDSLNFSRTYYFKENKVLKINDNNTTTYYHVGDHLYNDQGTAANPATSKSLMDVITDTFQGLYAALFP
jgi:hypothetical protein